MNPEAAGIPITLSGHMDTVHPRGLFGFPPVRIANGRIYGPGVIDCKGGITAAGIPCVDSLGTSGGGIHYADEWMLLVSLAEEAKRIAAIIYCF